MAPVSSVSRPSPALPLSPSSTTCAATSSSASDRSTSASVGTLYQCREASRQYQSRSPSAEIAMPSAPIVIGCRAPSGSSCSTNGRPPTLGTQGRGGRPPLDQRHEGRRLLGLRRGVVAQLPPRLPRRQVDDDDRVLPRVGGVGDVGDAGLAAAQVEADVVEVRRLQGRLPR